ncbi:MAG TPA: PA2779 family protein [Desulfomonilia bacterium]|nr:PA2779 family protein [Desulfomonilia bacterium]
MITRMRNRTLATLITFHLVFFVTSPAFAAMIPSLGSSPHTAGDTLQKDIDTVQRALETKMVQEKLKAYGLTSEEVAAKLPSMTPDQIHTLAAASNDVLAGGDGLGVIIAVLVIIILVIIILKLLHHDIIVRMSGLDDYHSPSCAYLG